MCMPISRSVVPPSTSPPVQAPVAPPPAVTPDVSPDQSPAESEGASVERQGDSRQSVESTARDQLQGQVEFNGTPAQANASVIPSVSRLQPQQPSPAGLIELLGSGMQGGADPAGATGGPAPTTARGQAGARVGSAYGSEPYDGAAPLGALASHQERLNALSSISQLDNLPGTPEAHDRNRCGPSSLVAGMILADGYEGLGHLAVAVEDFNQSSGANLDLSDLQATYARLSTGEGTREDISQVQEALYRVLDAQETNPGVFINNATLAEFIENSPAVKEAFITHSLQIENIDTGDADDEGNHFVLTNGSMVYDPWPREGGQIIDGASDAGSDYAAAIDAHAYPLRIDAGAQQLNIENMHRHPTGEVSFSAQMGGQDYVGAYDTNNNWSAQPYPQVGESFPASATATLTLNSVTRVPHNNIRTMDGTTRIASFSGTMTATDGSSLQVRGQRNGDGSMRINQYLDPTTGTWKAPGT